MNIAETKVELAQRILSTNDKDLINHFKAIFSTRDDDWWDTLPDTVKDDVDESLKQVERGETITHKQAMKKYAKWLKK